MKIDIARLPEDGSQFIGEEPGGILELENDKFVEIDGPLKYDFKAYIVSDELIIQGKLSLSVKFRCSRCDTFFPAEQREDNFVCAKELEAETESVDLTEDMREAMLLTFPAYPVCSEGCSGLCSQCGMDLNEGECSCEAPSDMRWGELDKLNIEKK